VSSLERSDSLDALHSLWLQASSAASPMESLRDLASTQFRVGRLPLRLLLPAGFRAGQAAQNYAALVQGFGNHPVLFAAHFNEPTDAHHFPVEADHEGAVSLREAFGVDLLAPRGTIVGIDRAAHFTALGIATVRRVPGYRMTFAYSAVADRILCQLR
jgi:hypothetical protein